METQNKDISKKDIINNIDESPSSKSTRPSKSKKAQLAKDALEFLRIKELALESSDKDNTEKILKLKKLIAEGQYEVDLDALSEKITQELL